MNTDEIDNRIEIHIARIMAAYGDNPEEFILQMKLLVLDWMAKANEIKLKLNK